MFEDCGTMAEQLDESMECFEDKIAIESLLFAHNAEVKARNAEILRNRRDLLHKNNIGKDEYIIICDARKDSICNTLMYVDRRKNKSYWWTHDISIVLHGTFEEMYNVASRLKYNNPRVVSVKKYLSV